MGRSGQSCCEIPQSRQSSRNLGRARLEATMVGCGNQIRQEDGRFPHCRRVIIKSKRPREGAQTPEVTSTIAVPVGSRWYSASNGSARPSLYLAKLRRRVPRRTQGSLRDEIACGFHTGDPPGVRQEPGPVRKAWWGERDPSSVASMRYARTAATTPQRSNGAWNRSGPRGRNSSMQSPVSRADPYRARRI
jgi:hypothetical protein